MSKICILTASPIRDLPIDNLIADKLKEKGHEVFIRPCLREGRNSLLELQPDVIVVPPIRNPYARDFAEDCKRFGCAVVTRHTEASCDWQDFKSMNQQDKIGIVGAFRYDVDCEIVWGEDEAQILRQRGCKFPVISVGSFAADVYKTQKILDSCMTKEVLFQKHGLDLNKPLMVIFSAWGFIDASPDLHVDEQTMCSKDEQGRTIWLAMIKDVWTKYKDKYNILVTIHPNIDKIPYENFLKPLNIPLNADSHAVDLIKNCDLLIHGGSTAAMGAHFLNKPTLQYGDQNQKGGWFGRAETALSKIAPYAKTVDDLLAKIETVEFGKSNADEAMIKALETGRYGNMDGKATERAAEIIDKLTGKFKFVWPLAHRDYDQLLMFKQPERIVIEQGCGVCQSRFYRVNPQWIQQLVVSMKITPEQLKMVQTQPCCPQCAARFVETT